MTSEASDKLTDVTNHYLLLLQGETQQNDPSVSIHSPPPTQSPTQIDNEKEPLSVTASIQESSVNINSNPTTPPNDELNVPRKVCSRLTRYMYRGCT